MARVDTTSPLSASPLGSTPTLTTSRTGIGTLDGLLGGTKWGTDPVGSSVDLQYSFPTAGSTWAANYGYREPQTGFAALTAAQKEGALKAIAAWSEVANIRFVEITETSSDVGTIRFASSSAPSTAWAYLPGATPIAGDVWIGRAAALQSAADGSYGLVTFIHELGHALGLKHPHEGTAMPSAGDYLGHSVMSYKDHVGDAIDGYGSSFFPTTAMLHDIAAIQYLYGANTTTRAGDTVYSWTTGEQLFECIWDGGGNDTVSWANQSTAAVIDLRQAAWSELGPARWAENAWDRKTLCIAYNCDIENATGGSAADTIRGNALANTLRGGAGNDMLYGIAGDDLVYGDAANDQLFGEDGHDRLYGGDGDDRLTGAAGNDRIWGDAGNDQAWGDLGLDQIDGGAGNDTLYGDGTNENAADGADQIWGGAGIDTIYGGGGADQISGQDGDDVLFGGTGNDTIDGGGGLDTASYASAPGAVTVQLWNGGLVTGAHGTDSLVSIERVRGSSAADRLEATSTGGVGLGTAVELYGNGGNDTLVGGSANDWLEGGDGIDELTGLAGNDRLSGGNGDDVLRGGAGTDTLYGDAGFDRFDFDALLDSAVGGTCDSIFGFQGVGAPAGDRIDLATIDANGLVAGDQAFSFIGLGLFTGAGQARVYASGADTILQLNTDGVILPDFELKIVGVSAGSWVAGDFVL